MGSVSTLNSCPLMRKVREQEPDGSWPSFFMTQVMGRSSFNKQLEIEVPGG